MHNKGNKKSLQFTDHLAHRSIFCCQDVFRFVEVPGCLEFSLDMEFPYFDCSVRVSRFLIINNVSLCSFGLKSLCSPCDSRPCKPADKVLSCP